ncbi:MAG: glycerate kinase [Verrucomicrobiales bacterium]|jgi:glycerate kinase
MHIVAAMDKFKGTLTAAQAAQAVAVGLSQVIPGVEVDILPIADGGEGTTAAAHVALGGELRHIAVPNAVGSQLVRAPILFVTKAHRKIAIMEMSAAAGLELLDPGEYDPFKASTEAVGQMLIYAEKEGAREIIIGIGGSATNDGGVGVAKAYGYVFEDSSGDSLQALPEQLAQVVRLRRPENFVPPQITVACDVANPLLGSTGATHVYATQKGASPDDLPVLESRMAHLADLTANALGEDFRNVPGAGAAGGLGFGLMAFLNAQLKPGFPLLADLMGIEQRIACADAVITGEGSIDAQTLNGKAPMGIAEIAARLGKPVIAIGGKVDHAAVEQLFDHTLSLVDSKNSEQRALAEAGEVLTQRAAEAGKWIVRH